MIPEHYQVAGLMFDDGDLVIQYMTIPTDVRVDGHIVASHQLHLSAAHPDYGDDIELLQMQAVKCLKNALEDFNSSVPFDPDPDDGDDERGMGE